MCYDTRDVIWHKYIPVIEFLPIIIPRLLVLLFRFFKEMKWRASRGSNCNRNTCPKHFNATSNQLGHLQLANWTPSVNSIQSVISLNSVITLTTSPFKPQHDKKCLHCNVHGLCGRITDNGQWYHPWRNLQKGPTTYQLKKGYWS